MRVYPAYLQTPYAFLLRCFGLWRWHEGQLIGLDYAGVRALRSLGGLTLSPTDFHHLQQLEAACIKQSQKPSSPLPPSSA